MEISKEHRDVAAGTVTDEELARINTFAKTALKADEVYAFAVKLCDNEVDRDFERFPRKTLEDLAELFVGKSGIFDHNWSAQTQTARIYRTELVEEERFAEGGQEAYDTCYVSGEPYYAFLMGLTAAGEREAYFIGADGTVLSLPVPAEIPPE